MSELERELQYVKEKLGTVSLKTIANNLGKSTEAIGMALYRKYGTQCTKTFTGMITAGELAKALKVDRNTVIGWINRHGLKSVRKVTHSKKKFTFIEVEHFWEWCYYNLEKVDVTKIERLVLIPEPDWLEEAQKLQRNTKNYKTWTTQEEYRLLELVESGKKYGEIARIMNRTTSSIEKKYGRLRASLSKSRDLA
ncbi:MULTISPECIES: hypothetical protein [Bacillota]|uniref:hypothetical protein n=1 Tax=Bacillota TaxID=1239 RepID=UPI0039EF4C89